MEIQLQRKPIDIANNFSKENMAVDQVRTEVESALAILGLEYLSSYPEKVGKYISASSLYKQCGNYSMQLEKGLMQMNIEVTFSSSGSVHDGSGIHWYLVRNVDDVEVIIDPTLGQFLIGYNHIFVGTREKLRDLVFIHSGENKCYQYNPLWFGETPNPKKIFELAWGNIPRAAIEWL